MPTLETVARNAACDAVVDLIDAGAGPGTLVFQTSGDVEVATLTFSDPAFGAAGAVTAGKATANAITSDTNATGGIVAQASIFDSNSLKILEGTVATSGADFTITSTTIAASETVSVSLLEVSVPAS